MLASLWRGVKIGFTIIGTTIGAGFASGREIWEFFGSYGADSEAGILLAVSLFAVCTMTIMWIAAEVRATNYLHVLQALMGKRLTVIFDGLILTYLFSVSIVMFAGSGATFAQWGFSYSFGVVLIALLSFLVLLFAVKGLLSLNALIVPVLTFVLLFVSIRFLSGLHFPGLPEDAAPRPVWPSALTYTALNIVPLLAVLSTFTGEWKHKGEIVIAALVGAGGLGIVACFLNRALLQSGKEVGSYEIPLFSLLKFYPVSAIVIVTAILWLAIYTTAVSNLHGIICRLARVVRLPSWLLAFVLISLMLPLSRFGFSHLVQVLYPLYGVTNLFLLAILLLYPLSRR
ncbi:membrane protein [Bacillaceae bacterium]